jgi:hypothetical protein
MHTARKRVKDLPILAQGLPAVFVEGLPAVLFIRRPSGGFNPIITWDVKHFLHERHPSRSFFASEIAFLLNLLIGLVNFAKALCCKIRKLLWKTF